MQCNGGFRLEIDENGERLMEDAPEAPGDLHVEIEGGGDDAEDLHEPLDEEPPTSLIPLFNQEMFIDWDDYENDEEVDLEYLPSRHFEGFQCKSHVRLTVTSPFGVYTNRCPDGMRLYEALRKVTDFLFKGRPMFHVKKLGFFPNSYRPHTAIRLPQGFKIRIEKLELFENQFHSFEALKTIIDDASFPLKVVKIFGCIADPNLSCRHPIVLGAEKVIIDNLDSFGAIHDLIDDLMADCSTKTILRFKNPVVNLYRCLYPNKQVYFVGKWAATRPSIGRIIMFGFTKHEFLLSILALMREKLDAKPGILKNEKMKMPGIPILSHISDK